MWIFITVVIIAVVAIAFTYPRSGALFLSLHNYWLAWRAKLSKQGYVTNTHSVVCFESKNASHQQRPLVVLIHGFSADKSVWLPMAQYLGEEYHLLIPDLPGHGETGYLPYADYSIAAQAECIAQLIVQAGYQKAHLIGNSMGGFIAAHMAIYAPQHVSNIILFNPAGVITPEPSTMIKLIQQGDNPFLMQRRKDFYRFMRLCMHRPPYVPRIVIDHKADQYIARNAELTHVFKHFTHPDGHLDERITDITCPTLVVWGQHDQLIHVTGLDVWSKIQSSETVLLHDLGHMPMVEAPRRSSHLVRSFVARHGESKDKTVVPCDEMQ